MSKGNIILTGFMGTGKSTVGRLLAQRLAYRFVDTDELIVARYGRSIADIFADEGEATFRALEADVALELGEQTELVIATGGRLLLDNDNAQALGHNGHLFCLTASPETIYQRVKDDGQRPLLNVPNPQARIRHLLAKREAGYGRFLQIETDGKTAVSVTEEIVQWLTTM